MALHIIKLVVGCETIDDLLAWHQDKSQPWVMHTRMTPKRIDEVLDGVRLADLLEAEPQVRERVGLPVLQG